MDTLNLVFFESAIWLGIFSFLLFAVVLLARQRWAGAARRYSLPATLAVIVLLFVVQRSVTTQRERILLAVDRLITAVENGDAAAMEAVFSRRYDCEDMDHQAVVADIEAWLRAISIQDTRITRREVAVDGDRGEMTLGARATVRTRGGIGGLHVGRWRLSWRKEAGGWKITALRPEKIDGRPIGSMEMLRGYRP